MPELFERWLAGRPLADRSRREYARNVRAYCAWLAVTPDRDGWQGAERGPRGASRKGRGRGVSDPSELEPVRPAHVELLAVLQAHSVD